MSPIRQPNRLIIIGNGFDLAHGYKTSYKDFLFHIILKKLKEFKEKLNLNEYNPNDNHPQFYFRTDLNRSDHYRLVKRITDFENQIKINTNDLFGQFQEFIKSSGVEILFPSQLIEKIYNDTTIKNWVDIEEAYYSLIKNLFHHKKMLSLNDSEVMAIKMSNDSISFLTSELEDYLIENTKELITVPGMVMKFLSAGNYATTYILNFNYTKTFTQYFEINSEYKVINIHGELRNKENPMVFGLGDENHSLYPQIVESNIDEALHNVKSLKYLETTNYQALKLAIDEFNFHVDIIGHSCGISDRTLLKEVFNHTNCFKVNIHHHNGLSSYKSSIYGASRYFDNNFEMKQKIESYNPELTIPQKI